MAKYSDIKGFTVQTLSSDTTASAIPGTTWSSGGALPSAVNENAGAGATYNAALSFGGNISGVVGETDSYNGTSWTEVAEMNTARRLLAGAGTQTSALAYGGWPPNKSETEEWNGSAWTEVNDLNTARRQASGVGVNAEGCLMVGGKATAATANTESWNGSSWTEVNDLNTAREGSNNWGTYTSAISAGGINNPGATIASVESWNGSSWTEIVDLNVGRRSAGTSGPDNTSGLFFGGNSPAPAVVASTEHFDGSSWTEVGDLSTARTMTASAGHDAGSSLAIGGTSSTADVALTEEFEAPAVFNQITEGQLFFNSTTNTFKETIFDLPAGSWSSGGDLNTARKGSSGFGVLTSNIVAGGNDPGSSSTYDIVEQYNGSSWTEITDLNTGRRSGKAVGSTTAGLVIGGVGTPPSRYAKETESWNGSAWTEVGDLTRPTSTQSFGSAGASNTSAIIFGGEPGTTYYTYTEQWDGSSWTEVNNLNTGRQSPAGFGIVTAAICAGGYSPPAPPGNVVASNESWDGTNWTEVNDLNTARGQQGGSGAFTAGLIYGGNAPPGRKTNTEAWDGTSYTELNDMSTSRYEFGYAPNGVSPQGNTGAIVAGGYTTTDVATTEEWAVDLANKTITST